MAVTVLAIVFLAAFTLFTTSPRAPAQTGWGSGLHALGYSPEGHGVYSEAVATPEAAAFHFQAFTAWARAKGVQSFYQEALDQPWRAASEGARRDRPIRSCVGDRALGVC